MSDIIWTEHFNHPGRWDRSFEPLPMPALLDASAARQPSAPCLDFLGRRYSYAQVKTGADRFAHGLQQAGIGKGDRVGLFLPNCPHYVFAYYGALKAGATLVNFSPLYTVEELEHQALDSGTRTMVCLDVAQLFPNVDALLDKGVLDRLIIGSLAEALPPLKSWLYRLFRSSERSPYPADARHIPFARLIDNPGRPQPVAIDPHNDIALLQYTGGTTGTPKGAMLSHANLSINAQQVDAVDPEPQAEDRILGALPFFHVFANTCVLTRTILRGGEIVMLPKFELKAALESVERKRITAIPGVPTMYQAMLDYPDIGRFSLSSVRVCISGGAPMPAELKARFEALTGAVVVEGYGLTESAGVVSTNPYKGVNKTGSIGQPLPGTEVVIVDQNDPTRRMARGERGEITVAGPQIMRGYWNRPDTLATTFVDGRLRTGDVGFIDEDGYIFIVDRIKDLILVGGFNVYPSVLEAQLYQHAAVKEAIVIGVPDPYLGERPKAFVTLNDGMQASADVLLEFLNAHVGKHERAVAVEVRTSLPKTMIGKLSRKELVAEERARAAAASAGASIRPAADAAGRVA